jgi:diguanylate cyclase (GGDEF)-like protein
MIHQIRVSSGDREWNPIVSIGVASLNKNIASFADLLQMADQALYLAKQKGQNKIELWKILISS